MKKFFATIAVIIATLAVLFPLNGGDYVAEYQLMTGKAYKCEMITKKGIPFNYFVQVYKNENGETFVVYDYLEGGPGERNCKIVMAELGASSLPKVRIGRVEELGGRFSCGRLILPNNVGFRSTARDLEEELHALASEF